MIIQTHKCFRGSTFIAKLLASVIDAAQADVAFRIKTIAWVRKIASLYTHDR